MTEALSRAEGLLSEMASIVQAELGNHAISNAGELAGQIVASIGRQLGGAQVYIPRGAALDRHLRDVQIRAAHDGTVDGKNGVLSLAKRHDLSELAVYRILARGRITNVV